MSMHAMIEAAPDPKFIRRFDDLRLDAPLAAVEQFGPKELVVRVELEEELTRGAL